MVVDNAAHQMVKTQDSFGACYNNMNGDILSGHGSGLVSGICKL